MEMINGEPVSMCINELDISSRNIRVSDKEKDLLKDRLETYSYIEGIIKVSSWNKDGEALKCYYDDGKTPDDIGLFVSNCLNPLIPDNIIKDENRESLINVFCPFAKDMIETYDRSNSFMFGRYFDDGCHTIIFRHEFSSDFGDWLEIPISTLKRFVNFDKGTHIHYYSVDVEKGVTFDKTESVS